MNPMIEGKTAVVLFLVTAMAFLPVAPAWAHPECSSDENLQVQSGGLSLDQMQASQAQEQQELQNHAALINALDNQALPVGLEFTSAPEYKKELEVDAPFESQWTLSNADSTARKATLLTVITPVGTTDSKEFYLTDQQIPSGGGTVPFNISKEELSARGIGAGQYIVAFVAFDASGNRLGGSNFGFFGNTLSIGSAIPAFTELPSYSAKLPAEGDFNAGFSIGNSGTSGGKVSLLTVITPVGSSDSKEFYLTNQDAPPGGGPIPFTITRAELAAQGIGPGEHTVAFAAFDAFGNRLGGPKAGFFGNPLVIGAIQPEFLERPTFSNELPRDGDFTAQFKIGNSGQADAKVTLLTVMTPVGTADSKEFYLPNQAVPAGGATLPFTISQADLASQGITPGQYLVTFKAYAAFDRLLKAGTADGYFGMPLSIGTSTPSLPQRPTFTATVPKDQDFVADFQIANTGDTTANQTTLLSVFTPVRTNNSIEVYRKVNVPAGGGLFQFRLTAPELALLNLFPGTYTLSFLVFDPFGNRAKDSFFGSLVKFLSN